MGKVLNKFFIVELLIVSLFLYFIFNFDDVSTLLGRVLGEQKVIVEWSPLYVLAFDYLRIICVTSVISISIAFILGVAAHLYKWEGLKDLLLSFSHFGTTFPTIALMSLLVPVYGYGIYPVVIALVIYGIMPVLVNTIEGLDKVDEGVVSAAKGLGMNRYQLLFKIELPLAMQFIIAGVRTTVIITIAASSLGAIVGAGGLGIPIVTGIRNNDIILILKGTVPIALIAVVADRLLRRLENSQAWRRV